MTNESNDKYMAKVEQNKKGSVTDYNRDNVNDAANMAFTTGYVAADVEEAVEDGQVNDEEYDDGEQN